MVKKKMRERRERQPARRTRLVLFVLLGLVGVLVYGWLPVGSQQQVALAHAFVVGSDPVDGSTVSAVPRVVRIFFDAPISPASIARVYTPDERMVDAGGSSIPGGNPRELDTLLQTPGQLPQGSYTVRWTALASDDGHTTQGVIGFNVGQSSAGLQGVTILGPSTSNKLPQLDLIGILAIAWEWLVMMALTFWIGILITEGFILANVERTSELLARSRKQARPLQWLCLLALFMGEIISLFLRSTQLTQAINGQNIDFALLGQILGQSLYGYLWLARLVLIASALGLLWWVNREQTTSIPARRRSWRRSRSQFGQLRQRVQVTQEDSSASATGITNAKSKETDEVAEAQSVLASTRRSTIVLLVLAALILLTLALSGDAAQLAQPHFSAILLDWLYLMARCVWVGGLTYLGYVLLPLLPEFEPDHPSEILTTLLRRFHPLMLGAVAVLLVSGFYLAEASLTTPQQLVSDPYGRALLVGWLLVAIMLGLSAYVLLILRPRLIRQEALLPVVNAEMHARRARQSAMDQTARGLKQALVLQSWLGAAVLLCSAIMSFFAPPIVFPSVDYNALANNGTSPATSTATSIVQTQRVGNLSVTLQVLPGQAGYTNTVIVTMKDTSSGDFITDAQVEITTNMEIMNMGTAHATIKSGNPTYIATFGGDTAFSMFGVWDIRLSIQRPHQATVQALFAVTL